MNNFPNVIKVAKASKHRSTFPLDFQHLTTMDFGKTSILHAMEVMPNDEIDIDMSSMVQFAPMVVPTMSEVNLYVRAFFVPYRFVWKDWEDFFASKKTASGTTRNLIKVPFISSFELSTAFFDNQYLAIHTNGDAYDFINNDSATASEHVKWKLTPLGRLYYQIILGLGYSLHPLLSSSSIGYEEWSALPLLSLVKVFRDYYVNPNYNYTTIDSILNNDFSAGYLNAANIKKCLEFVAFGWFEGDIFTQAWAHPESSDYSSNLSSQISSSPFGTFMGLYKNSVEGADSSDVNFSYIDLENTNPIAEGDYPAVGLTQRSINILKAIYNFSLRRAASGMRYVDQLLSRFGIRLNENEAKRSMFLGSSVLSPSISRVDATSAGVNTENGTYSSLGDFSGRGQINPEGNGAHWHFKNEHNDFGMLIVVAHMMPRTNYYQGLKPHVNHVTFDQFFNPDLEDIGNAPIKMTEVFDDYISSKDLIRDNGQNPTSTNYLRSVFGWAPNFYDYKSQQSYLTGDFRLGTINSELKSFQLFRELSAPGETQRGTKSIALLNEQFQKFDIENVKDYNRIWLTQTDDADHFIASFLFKVRATRDCNSLGNSLLAELNEHGNDVGDLIKVHPNGKYF